MKAEATGRGKGEALIPRHGSCRRLKSVQAARWVGKVHGQHGRHGHDGHHGRDGHDGRAGRGRPGSMGSIESIQSMPSIHLRLKDAEALIGRAA